MAVSMDAVQVAVAKLREFGEAMKSGDRLFDVDIMLDVIEQVSLGVSHLRSGAGSVQQNVELLEAKIKEEVVSVRKELEAIKTELVLEKEHYRES